MISLFVFGFLCWSSQHPDNRETGYSNVLGQGGFSQMLTIADKYWWLLLLTVLWFRVMSQLCLIMEQFLKSGSCCLFNEWGGESCAKIGTSSSPAAVAIHHTAPQSPSPAPKWPASPLVCSSSAPAPRSAPWLQLKAGGTFFYRPNCTTVHSPIKVFYTYITNLTWLMVMKILVILVIVYKNFSQTEAL